jgi:hypothetical protein
MLWAIEVGWGGGGSVSVFDEEPCGLCFRGPNAAPFARLGGPFPHFWLQVPDLLVISP